MLPSTAIKKRCESTRYNSDLSPSCHVEQFQGKGEGPTETLKTNNYTVFPLVIEKQVQEFWLLHACEEC